jgi:hypothetical protein
MKYYVVTQELSEPVKVGESLALYTIVILVFGIWPLNWTRRYGMWPSGASDSLLKSLSHSGVKIRINIGGKPNTWTKSGAVTTITHEIV